MQKPSTQVSDGKTAAKDSRRTIQHEVVHLARVSQCRVAYIFVNSSSTAREHSSDAQFYNGGHTGSVTPVRAIWRPPRVTPDFL